MKKLLSIMLLAFVVMTGQAKEKVIVWEQPTTEYGIYGDGFFNLALDVTKVELKDNETVVYITAFQRGDSEKYDYWFQFVGDTYLKVGEQRYTLVSADNIELNKHVYPAKDGKRDMVFHFPALPQGTKAFDFIEGDGERVHKGSELCVVLANPVYLAGYIERLGTGTTDIVSLCEQEGLPTPQFAQDAFFKVTIYRKLKAAESNNDKLGQSNKEENAENTFVNNAFGCIHSGIDSKQSNKESNIGSNIGNIDSNIDSLTYQQQTVVRGDRSCES